MPAPAALLGGNLLGGDFFTMSAEDFLDYDEAFEFGVISQAGCTSP